MSGRFAIAGMAVAIGSYGFAFGVLARATGLGWVAVLAMSALAYSGGAQAAFVAALATGTPTTALFSGVLVNLRLGIYGAIANRVLATQSTIQRLIGVHFASDETIALTAAAESDKKTTTYWTSGLAFFTVWVSSTVAGALAGGAIGDPAALGLDAAFPAVFIALLLPMLNTTTTKVAAVVAAVTTIAVTPQLTSGLPILAAAATALAASALLTRTSPT